MPIPERQNLDARRVARARMDGTLYDVVSNEGSLPERRHYAHHRPYADPPALLTDLGGPTTGLVELTITIDWGPKRRYNVSEDADRRILYERVLREAPTTAEVARYVNGAALVDVWPLLWLPKRVRQSWEGRFPELTNTK